MAEFLENVGLAEIQKDRDALARFLYVAHEDAQKTIRGYSGLDYTYYKCGSVEIWERIKPLKEGQWKMTGFDVHCSGHCVWDMVCGSIDLSHEDELPHKRTHFFRGPSERKTMGIPIEVINADVLPSLSRGEYVKMQVIAFPLRFKYYKDEQAYIADQPKGSDGNTIVLGEGALVPFQYVMNHRINRDASKKDLGKSDRLVTFRAKVERFPLGELEVDGELVPAFAVCCAQTKYGPLEFVHAFDEVPEEDRKWIRAGCIISGVAVLSADVAIFEHGHGIIKDFEHNLTLLRSAFEGGDPERLRPVLAPDVTYHKDIYDRSYAGTEEVIDIFHQAQEQQRKTKLKYRTRYAHIVEVKESAPEFTERLQTDVQFIGKSDEEFSTLVLEKPAWEYPVGTRCLILFANDHDGPESIAFLEVNNEGCITYIRTSTDSRYRFQYDSPP